MLKLSLLIAACLLPATAGAQSFRDLYIGGNVGANTADSMLSSGGRTKVETNTGPIGLAAVGWKLDDGLRAEIEGSYRSNDISRIDTRRLDGLLEPLANLTGGAKIYAAMINVVYDTPVQAFGLPIRPYIGGGAGYGRLDFHNASGRGYSTFNLQDNNTFRGPSLVSFGASGAFAYQAIVGASLPLEGAPGLEMTFEYRFFGAEQINIPVTRVSTSGDLVNGAVPSSAARDGFQVQDNAVLVGFRYAFGTP